MSLPGKETVTGWIGMAVRTSGGDDLGHATMAYADDATDLGEWLAVELPGGRRRIVPLAGASESGGTVTVPFTRETVEAAPEAGTEQHLDRAAETTLYDHYGIPYSAEASPTTLPVEEAQAEPGRTGAAVLTSATGDGDGARGAAGLAAAARDVAGRARAASPAAADSARRYGPALVAAAVAVAALRLLRGYRAAVLRRRRPSARARRYAEAAATRGRARVVPVVRATGPALRKAGPAVRAAGPAVRAAGPVVRAAAPSGEQLREAGARAAGASREGGRVAGHVAARAGTEVLRAGLVGAAAGTMAAQRAAGPLREGLAKAAGGAVHAAAAGQEALRGTREQAGNAADAVVTPVTDTVDSVTSTWRTTMGLIKSSVVFGAGYVLGTRAGRERYEKIKQRSQQFMERPETQRATQRVQEAVTQRLPGGQTIGRTLDSRRERRRARRTSDYGGPIVTTDAGSTGAPTTGPSTVDLTAGTEAPTVQER